MAEALFYHLTAQPLERALPDLLERTLARGWRAVVRAGSAERADDLDRLLWTFRDDSFLPHGTAGTGHPERQPVYLTSGGETPNAPDVLFLVDGADTEDFAAFARTVVMFSGEDRDALERARAQWRRARESAQVTYWKQSPEGRWEKAADGTA